VSWELQILTNNSQFQPWDFNDIPEEQDDTEDVDFQLLNHLITNGKMTCKSFLYFLISLVYEAIVLLIREKAAYLTEIKKGNKISVKNISTFT